MKKLRLGILGASTLQASDVLAWLAKWHFPYEDIYLYDTKEHCGRMMFCKDKYRTIQEVDETKIALLELCFICDPTLFEKYEVKCKDTSYTINLTQHHDDEMMVLPPLLLPELISTQKHFWIPNASICMMLHILHIARDKGTIQSVDFTSMHSASEVGMKGCIELQEQISAYEHNRELEADVFPLSTSSQSLPLLFQALPQTSPILESGEAREEILLQTVISEFMKEEISVFPTCVRIASLRGLAISMHLHFQEAIQVDTLIDAYASSSSCICFDDKEHNMYPILADVLHDYRIFIGRMRSTAANDFSAWAVCDDQSIRCGAAVQMAFYVYHNFLNKA